MNSFEQSKQQLLHSLTSQVEQEVIDYIRMTDETAIKIERWYQADNCRSKNEFIEKAVNRYLHPSACWSRCGKALFTHSAFDSS